MLKKIESSITHLDKLPEEECKHVPLNCIWPITSHYTSLTVIITCLKWTSNLGFCVRVTAYQLGAPNNSKQTNLDDHHPLLRSLTDALHLYEAFPNLFQIPINSKSWKSYWNICISNSKKLNATKFRELSTKLGCY